MPSIEQIVNQILGQFRMIRSAPIPYISALVVCIFAAWYVADLRYDTVVENQRSEISSLKTQLAEYRGLGGAPSDLRKRIAALEKRISGRSLTGEARKRFIAALKKADTIKLKVSIIVTCEECADFGNQLKAAIEEAGWNTIFVSGLGYTPLKGLKLSWSKKATRKPGTTALGDALAAAGLQYETIRNPTFNQPALFVGRRIPKPQ